MLLSKVTQTQSLKKLNSTCYMNHFNEVEQMYQIVWFNLKPKHSVLVVTTPRQGLKKSHQSF